MSSAKKPMIPTNKGQVEEKTSFPIVALTNVENFTQVAGKRINAVAIAVPNRMA